MFCTECGSKVDDYVTTCPNCGMIFGSSPVPQQQPVYQPQQPIPQQQPVYQPQQPIPPQQPIYQPQQPIPSQQPVYQPQQPIPPQQPVYQPQQPIPPQSQPYQQPPMPPIPPQSQAFQQTSPPPQQNLQPKKKKGLIIALIIIGVILLLLLLLIVVVVIAFVFLARKGTDTALTSFGGLTSVYTAESESESSDDSDDLDVFDVLGSDNTDSYSDVLDEFDDILGADFGNAIIDGLGEAGESSDTVDNITDYTDILGDSSVSGVTVDDIIGAVSVSWLNYSESAQSDTVTEIFYISEENDELIVLNEDGTNATNVSYDESSSLLVFQVDNYSYEFTLIKTDSLIVGTGNIVDVYDASIEYFALLSNSVY